MIRREETEDRRRKSATHVFVVCIALVGASFVLSPVSFLLAQSDPLPEAEAFLERTRMNLARSQREQGRYGYKERRTELHTNPFGRLGTGGTLLYDVEPGPEAGVFYRRLLERDGMPVPDATAEKIDRRGRTTGARDSIDDVAGTLQFELQRREIVEGRPAIAVRFSPRRDAKPQTREGRLAKLFSGTIWIDEAAHEVMRIEGTAIDDMSYGFGIVARLNEGTTAKVERRRVDDSIWLPTSLRIVGQGRAILFRKLNIDFAIDWLDYHKRNP
jgi:hypothetical protein